MVIKDNKVECKICGKLFLKKTLGNHIRSHKILSEDYYMKYIAPIDFDIKCENSNCNNNKKFISVLGGYTKYCSKICFNKVGKNNKTIEKLKNSVKKSWDKRGRIKPIRYTKEEIQFFISNSEKLICKICENYYITYRGISSHVRQKHNISIKDYYDIFLKKDYEEICTICGNSTTFHSIRYGYRKFCSSRLCINNDPIRLEILKNRNRNKEEIRKLSKLTKKQWKNNKKYIDLMTTPGLEWRKRQGRSTSKRYEDPDERFKTSISIKKAYIDKPELRIKASNHSIQLWSDPDGPFAPGKPYWENLYKGVTKLGPNYAEKIILDILNNLYSNKYKYTGDFEFWIGRKNPDFLCYEKKKVIEHFGIWWHGEEHTGEPNHIHEKNRIEHFSNYGYDTLVIWEDELDDKNKIINKIINFHEGI